MVEITISDEIHAIIATQNGRRLAASIGFNIVEQAALSTAILEITSNVVKYAQAGQVLLEVIEDGQQVGIRVTVTDQGPGIEDTDLAMQDGFSTGKSLGLGLPGAKRLMSEFEINSVPGQGTKIKMIKWKNI